MDGTAEVIESREWDATATTDDIRVTATSAPALLHLILIIFTVVAALGACFPGRHYY